MERGRWPEDGYCVAMVSVYKTSVFNLMFIQHIRQYLPNDSNTMHAFMSNKLVIDLLIIPGPDYDRSRG